jgi:hypothetical protein
LAFIFLALKLQEICVDGPFGSAVHHFEANQMKKSILFGMALLVASVANAGPRGSLVLTPSYCKYLASRVVLASDPPEVVAAVTDLRAACKSGRAVDPQESALQGDPKAVLHLLMGSSTRVLMSDEDQIRLIEEGLSSGDPEFLYWLGSFAVSRAGQSFAQRVGLQHLFGANHMQAQRASMAWMEWACARGFDCSASGMQAKVDCVRHLCGGLMARIRESNDIFTIVERSVPEADHVDQVTFLSSIEEVIASRKLVRPN